MGNRAALAVVVVGVLTASCSGGHSASTIPSAGAAGGPSLSSAGLSPMGAHTTRAKSALIAPPGWATTATSAIVPANASDQGALDGNKSIRVTLGLQMRNVDAAKAGIAAGRVMSRDDFVSQYAPSADQVSAAVAYLRGQGFSSVTPAPNNLLVTATAPAATVEKAFSTKLHAFSGNGGTYYANVQPAFVPASLAGNVVAVLGLTNVTGLKPNPLTKPMGGARPGVFAADGSPSPTACLKNVNQTTGAPVCPRWYDPATFSIAYGVGSTPPATNTKIAIFSVGDTSSSVSDLRYNETQFGLPQADVITRSVGPPSADVSGATEWTLDMTYSQGMAYAVKRLTLYTVPTFAFSALTLAINTWANDDLQPIMNASVGGCEVFPYETGDMLVADMALVEAAAQGQTLFASTGDTGGFCGVAGAPPNGGVGGVPMVEYPASSPYAIAVGGTDLFSNVDGTYLGEQAWQSGGGGVSQFEYSPSWESGTQPVGTTAVGYSFRGLPDVAYDAALETAALLYQGGTSYITGGTSLASPMAAGVYARMQSAHGNTLGFAGPALYNAYRGGTPQQIAGPPVTELIGPFHDILQGSNGSYASLPKYDYTTGMGSIDVARLASALH
jgi:pseudomonalisin